MLCFSNERRLPLPRCKWHLLLEESCDGYVINDGDLEHNHVLLKKGEDLAHPGMREIPEDLLELGRKLDVSGLAVGAIDR